MLGGSIASFLGVVIERVPKHETLMGRSHCACGRPLKWYENVPIFGWLRTLGKTKCCNTRIPAWYFISELVCFLIGVIVTFFIVKTAYGL